MARKRRIAIKSKVNLYSIVERAIEEGVGMGYRRAFKHTEQPDESTMIENIEREVMNSLSEIINF